jgi:hypothetical protein
LKAKPARASLNSEPGLSSIAEVKVRGNLRGQLAPVVRNLRQAGRDDDSQLKAFGLDCLLGELRRHGLVRSDPGSPTGPAYQTPAARAVESHGSEISPQRDGCLSFAYGGGIGGVALAKKREFPRK